LNLQERGKLNLINISRDVKYEAVAIGIKTTHLQKHRNWTRKEKCEEW